MVERLHYKLNTKKFYTQIGGNEVNFKHSQDMLMWGVHRLFYL
jgi:hypothetical protein